MKSVNFKRKESVLRYGEDGSGKKQKKPINWDRIIYFFLLVVVLFFLGRYLWNRFMYVEAQGQVILDKLDISLTDDCRIMDWHVEEGDTVRPGDSLFTYVADEAYLSGGFGGGVNNLKVNPAREKEDPKVPDWVVREIYNLQKNISLKSTEISQNEGLIGSYEEELDRLRNEVILDVMPRSTLENYEDRIMRLKNENHQLRNEVGHLNRYLGELKKIQATGGDTLQTGNGIDLRRQMNGAGSGNNDGILLVHFSPVEGTVTRIFREQFEVALKSDNIMSLHRTNNIYVKAFFAQEDLEHLQTGDQVRLVFPDGTTSKGYIKRFYFTTHTLPDEFQKKYEPTQRSLPADIYPVDTSELMKWRAYYKMTVDVLKPKY